jgi:hypothetical protein
MLVTQFGISNDTKALCEDVSFSTELGNKPSSIGAFMIMNQEVWKDIFGYNGLYQVSSLGRIKSLSRTIFDTIGRKYTLPERIKPTTDGTARIMVMLRKDGGFKSFTVHRLVAIAFIPNPEKKRCINHKNGIQSDNRVENLEWATHGENNQHAHDNSLINTSKYFAKKPPQFDVEAGQDQVFVDIVGYEGWYQISNYGQVRSVDRIVIYKNGTKIAYKRQAIKHHLTKGGYCFVRISKNKKYQNFYIHRLVAKHFINQESGRNMVHHKDNNKLNNHHANLEWCTQSYNIIENWNTHKKLNGFI